MLPQLDDELPPRVEVETIAFDTRPDVSAWLRFIRLCSEFLFSVIYPNVYWSSSSAVT